MKASLAAIFALGLLCFSGAAFADGRNWHAGGGAFERQRDFSLDLATIAIRYVGRGKFTRLPGPWCADAVNVWLRAAGRRPLSGRMASAALAYGPLELHPRRGDLAVVSTRAGRYGHVGIVVADLGAEIEIVSGNWGHRVARSRVPRWQIAAFVRV